MLGETTYTIMRRQRVITITGVPADICQRCGQAHFSDDVARELDRRINELKPVHERMTVAPFKVQ